MRKLKYILEDGWEITLGLSLIVFVILSALHMTDESRHVSPSADRETEEIPAPQPETPTPEPASTSPRRSVSPSDAGAAPDAALELIPVEGWPATWEGVQRAAIDAVNTTPEERAAASELVDDLTIAVDEVLAPALFAGDADLMALAVALFSDTRDRERTLLGDDRADELAAIRAGDMAAILAAPDDVIEAEWDRAAAAAAARRAASLR